MGWCVREILCVLVGGMGRSLVWGGWLLALWCSRSLCGSWTATVGTLLTCGGGLVGFAVVIVVGKRPVNRSDPGS